MYVLQLIPFYTHGHPTCVSVQSLIRPFLGLCGDIPTFLSLITSVTLYGFVVLTMQLVSMSSFVRFKQFRHAVFEIKFPFKQNRDFRCSEPHIRMARTAASHYILARTTKTQPNHTVHSRVTQSQISKWLEYFLLDLHKRNVMVQSLNTSKCSIQPF